MAARLLALSTLVTCSAGAKLRATHRAASSSASASASATWIAYSEMAVQERSYWLSELTSTESALLLLQEAITSLKPTTKAASPAKPITNAAKQATKQTSPAKLTTTAASLAKPLTKAKNATVPEVAKVAPQALAAKHATVKDDLKGMDPAQLMKSLGIPSLKLSGKAALAPMLAMLKGLYDDSKERIAQQNAREEKSKKWFAAKELDHKKKLARIEGKHKNHTLSDEFYTNETRDENHYFSYWARCRERQHRQFHTNLKIQHSMMQKVKMMIDMYQKTISGTADPNKMRRQLQVVSGGVPEVVLMQVQNFCHDALVEVQAGRQEIDAWAQEDSMAVDQMLLS